MMMKKMNVKSAGFTLIELMIVVAIIGILASIAYPSYQNSVMKSRREDAKGALMGFANAMERHLTESNTYCDAADPSTGTAVSLCGESDKDTGAPAIFSDKSPVDGTTAYYNLTINTVSETTYTLYAAPTGPQANDKCGSLTLTNTGVRGVSGADTGVTAADCW